MTQDNGTPDVELFGGAKRRRRMQQRITAGAVALALAAVGGVVVIISGGGGGGGGGGSRTQVETGALAEPTAVPTGDAPAVDGFLAAASDPVDTTAPPTTAPAAAASAPAPTTAGEQSRAATATTAPPVTAAPTTTPPPPATAPPTTAPPAPRSGPRVTGMSAEITEQDEYGATGTVTIRFDQPVVLGNKPNPETYVITFGDESSCQTGKGYGHALISGDGSSTVVVLVSWLTPGTTYVRVVSGFVTDITGQLDNQSVGCTAVATR